MKRIPKNKLNGEDMRRRAEQLLGEKLPSLQVEGYQITTSMVLNVLIKAAIDKSRLEAVCEDLVAVVDGNTLRAALNRVLTADDLRQHEAEFKEALAACIPAEMPRRGLEMAVDYHDEPYYGKSETTRAYVSRGEAKDGTTYFWRIATLYVIWRGVRLTLAVSYVLQRLLKHRADLGFRPKVLYLDKGFCQGDVIQYLQRAKWPTVIACPIRGKTGGTRALCRGRHPYRTSYTFHDGTPADLAVVPTLTYDKKLKRRRRTWLVYALIHLDWSAKQTQRCYRRRFGIASSYRQLGAMRVPSNSRNVALRFFFLARALVLLNLWTFLRCLSTRVIAKGPFRLVVGAFRLTRFRAWLRRAIEHAFGASASIPIYRF